MRRFSRLLGIPEIQALLCLLALLVFCLPFGWRESFRQPSNLFFYYFVAWSLVVLLLALIAAGLRREEPATEEREPEGPGV